MAREKVLLNLRPACVPRPSRGCTLPKSVHRIQACTAFYKQSNHFLVAGPSGLMQGGGMGMKSDRVVSVWVFTRVEQQPNDFGVAELRCQSQRSMAIFTLRGRQQPPRIFNASQTRR